MEKYRKYVQGTAHYVTDHRLLVPATPTDRGIIKFAFRTSHNVWKITWNRRCRWRCESSWQICQPTRLNSSSISVSIANLRLRKLSYILLCRCTDSVISGSLLPRLGASSGCARRNDLQYGGPMRIYWISSSGHPTRGGQPVFGSGEVLTTPHRKSYHVTKCLQETRTWTDTPVQPNQRKKDMRFATWNVRSLYRAGSLTAAARELARYILDLVGVQEIW